MKLYDINNLRDDSFEMSARELGEFSTDLESIVDDLRAKIDSGETTAAEIMYTGDLIGIAEDALSMIFSVMRKGHFPYKMHRNIEDVLGLYDELCDEVDCDEKMLAVIASMHFMELLTDGGNPAISLYLNVAEGAIQCLDTSENITRLSNIKDIFDEFKDMMDSDDAKAVIFLLGVINVVKMKTDIEED